MTTRLTQHFTLEELTFSEAAIRHGITNTPDSEVLPRLTLVANNLELIRSILGNRGIHVNSGFRSPAVNLLVGGSQTSAHCEGWAVDITCSDYGTPKSVCEAIASSGLKFDQLIQEFGSWCHISFDPRMRQQVLTATKIKSKTHYTAGLK